MASLFRRAFPLIAVLILALPAAGGASLITNTKISSPQIGRDIYASHEAGADWGAKFATALGKLAAPGGRLTEEPSLQTVTTVITISKSNVLVDLYGVKANSPAQAATLITITGHNVTLQGLNLDASNITGANCGIKITASNVTLRDIIITGGAKGVCLDGSIAATLDHVETSGQTTTGVSIVTAAYASHIANSYFHGAPTGITVSADSVDTRLMGNRFDTTTAVSDSSSSTIRFDGSGWTLQDVAWQRDAANRWKTPDDVIMSANLGIGVSTAPVRLAVSDGSSAVAQTGLIGLPNNKAIHARNAANNADLPLIGSDTNNNVVLGGSGVASVKTSNALIVNEGTHQIDFTTANTRAEIRFGTAADTNLYRRTSNALATDDELDVGSSLTVVGNLIFGGPSGDTNLYRAAANTLRTDDALHIVRPVSSQALAILTSGESYARLSVNEDGKFYWGGGTAGTDADTNLYRAAAGTLRTDHSFHASGDIVAKTGYSIEVKIGNVAGGASGIELGGDTNLYRSAANTLATDDLFKSIRPASTSQALSFGDSGGEYFSVRADGLLMWGALNAPDTNLYRSAASTLSTDDLFSVARGVVDDIGLATRVTGDGTARWVISAAGKQEWGDGVTRDTNLFRAAPSVLRTDDTFQAIGDLFANTGTANEIGLRATGGRPEIFFGSAGDTSLYRSAANTLKTDDQITSAERITGSIGSVAQVIIGDQTYSDARITFGSAGDTNLYRSAADTLKTDDAFFAGAGVIKWGDSQSNPTCDSSTRGQMRFILGNPSVADVLYLCMKSAADAYAWKTIVTG